MQPWSVILMRVMRSRSRFIARDAMRRHQRILARAPHAADVVVARVHRGQQLADLLGRVLQVGVERHDALAAAALEAGDDRHVLAVVGVEQHDARDVGAALELLAQQRRRAVAAAVVDEDDLVGDVQRVERRIQAREQRRQAGLLVVDRDDDRQLRGSCHGRFGWSRRQSGVSGRAPADDLGDGGADAVDVGRASSPRAAAASRSRARCARSSGSSPSR